MFGNFSERKDFETFIRAGIRLLDKRDDITFLAVGDGPLLDRHIQMVPPKYASNFVFPGIRTDVESLINIFDIGVLATNSHVHGEGISNVILEYMALAKPVVATEGGGNPEIVRHNHTGVLVPPHSSEALAKELNKLLRNESLRLEMGQNGKKRVAEEFGLSKMTASYSDLYKRLGRNV